MFRKLSSESLILGENTSKSNDQGDDCMKFLYKNIKLWYVSFIGRNPSIIFNKSLDIAHS